MDEIDKIKKVKCLIHVGQSGFRKIIFCIKVVKCFVPQCHTHSSDKEMRKCPCNHYAASWTQAYGLNHGILIKVVDPKEHEEEQRRIMSSISGVVLQDPHMVHPPSSAVRSADEPVMMKTAQQRVLSSLLHRFLMSTTHSEEEEKRKQKLHYLPSLIIDKSFNSGLMYKNLHN